jgi:hypothetical protein
MGRLHENKPMKIPYLTHPDRSIFYPKLREAIRETDGKLPISLNLGKEGGYDGDVTIIISSPTEAEFEAGIELDDWTRFPARIRAAATALRDSGLHGRFRVQHRNGQLGLSVN